MKQIDLYLKPYQSSFLKTILGTPIIITGRFNFAELFFSLLSKNEYKNDSLNKTTVLVPDWLFEKSNGKIFIPEIGNKIIGDYLDSLMDIQLYKFLKPYHRNPRLKIKDGINLFIEKFNLPDTLTFYERLKKRDFRSRKKKIVDNPAVYFNDLSSY